MGLFSAITGVIGGAQSASAYSNAASEIARGRRQGADTVDRTVSGVNQTLIDGSNVASARVTQVGDESAQGVRDAAGNAIARGDAAAAQANGYLDPYITAGRGAIDRLSAMAEDGDEFVFSQDDPSYQWRVQQGQQTLERNHAARGMSQSGGAMKALQRYAQNLASTEYAAEFDRHERTRARKFSENTTLANAGYQASGRAGDNLTQAAEYGGNMGFAGEQSAGNFRTTAANYSGNAHMRASEGIASNNLNAGLYRADAERGSADAIASSFLGRASSWNSALNAAGEGADGFVSGGFDGGKGFKWNDAFRGYSRS